LPFPVHTQGCTSEPRVSFFSPSWFSRYHLLFSSYSDCGVSAPPPLPPPPPHTRNPRLIVVTARLIGRTKTLWYWTRAGIFLKVMPRLPPLFHFLPQSSRQLDSPQLRAARNFLFRYPLLGPCYVFKATFTECGFMRSPCPTPFTGRPVSLGPRIVPTHNFSYPKRGLLFSRQYVFFFSVWDSVVAK